MKVRSLLTTIGLMSALLAVPHLQPAQAQAAKPLRIMCIGASITMGQGVNGGYRLPLEKMLEGAGIPVEFVGSHDWNSKGMTWPLNDGYPGHRIDQIEYGATNVFNITSQPMVDNVRKHRPDVMLLLVGTNDVRQNYKLDEAPARLNHLVGTLQTAAPGAKILVASITPDQHFDDAVRRYNSGVAAAVAARAAKGENVQFVDSYAAVSPGVDMLPDRTHPNASGYMKLARLWFKSLFPKAPHVAFALTREGANEFTAKSCLGYQITMKQNATVADLGIYTGGKLLNEAHAAGIFDTTGRLLSRVEVTAQDAPSGLFAYKKLERPLELQAGTSYVLASNSVGIPALVGTDASVDPLRFDNPRFYFDHNVAVDMTGASGTDLKFPGTDIRDINGALGYFGPNLRFAPQ